MTPFVKLWSRSLKRQRRQPLKRAGRPWEFTRPALEILEHRTLLSVVNWINPDGGNWDVPGNWSTDNLPGSGDDVVISTSLAATMTIASGDNFSVKSLTTAADDTLSITGGQLLLGANSNLSGALSMVGGELTASGSGITVQANGPTSISVASLYAQGGATLSLPGLTSYTSVAGKYNTLQATDTGSVLSLANLKALTAEDTDPNSWIVVNALSGGDVRLGAVTQISGPVSLTSDGSNSQLDISVATSFAGRNQSGYNNASVQVTDGGTLLDGQLTSIDQVSLTLDGTGELAASQWTAFTGSTLSDTGGVYILSSLTDVDGSNLSALSGGSLTLPGLTSLSPTSNSLYNTFQATGAGSVLNLSALTTVAQHGFWKIDAEAGAEINLSSLVSFGTNAALIDTGGSTVILDSKLTTLNLVNVVLDGTDPNVAKSWTSDIGGLISVVGGSCVFPGLTDVDDTNLEVAGGGILDLPGLKNYTSAFYNRFQAIGTGSVLDLSSLTTLTIPTQAGAATFNAGSGGEINLSSLNSLANASISDTGGSTILDGGLTTLSGVTVTLDGTDPHVANSWSSLTEGSLTVTAGSYDLPSLKDIDGSNLSAQNGASLTLPGLTSYVSTGNTNGTGLTYPSLQANGIGSVLDLSALTIATVPDEWAVDAQGGGTVNLSSLATLNGSVDGTFFQASGTGSAVDVSALATVNQTNLDVIAEGGGELNLADLPTMGSDSDIDPASITADGPGSEINFASLTAMYGGSLQVTNEGAISAPGLLTLQGVNYDFDGTGTLNIAAILFTADAPRPPGLTRPMPTNSRPSALPRLTRPRVCQVGPSSTPPPGFCPARRPPREPLTSA